MSTLPSSASPHPPLPPLPKKNGTRHSPHRDWAAACVPTDKTAGGLGWGQRTSRAMALTRARQPDVSSSRRIWCISLGSPPPVRKER